MYRFFFARAPHATGIINIHVQRLLNLALGIYINQPDATILQTIEPMVQQVVPLRIDTCSSA